MREILKRLPEQCFEIVIFGDECILNTPVEEWPVVEVLIAFYSTNFPLAKAVEYVKLRNPFMINDLEMDATLKDRRKVYELLQSQGIDVPFHVILDRDIVAGEPYRTNVVEEFDEYIVVNGVTVNKPLVEKPVDAENHNIYVRGSHYQMRCIESVACELEALVLGSSSAGYFGSLTHQLFLFNRIHFYISFQLVHINFLLLNTFAKSYSITSFTLS